MADAKKTWLSILIAGVVIVGVFVIALAGGAAYMVSRHLNAQFTSADAAEQQFAHERQRFAGRQPLIETRTDGEPIIRRPAENAATHEMQSLRALAYDPRANKLVRMDVPFWLLRLAPSNHFRFMDENIDFDSDRVHLTVEDLVRHGPGLILDTRTRRGTQVLVWTE